MEMSSFVSYLTITGIHNMFYSLAYSKYQLYGRSGPRQFTSARTDLPPQLVPPHFTYAPTFQVFFDERHFYSLIK